MAIKYGTFPEKNGHKLVPDVNLSFDTSPIFMAFVLEMDRIDKFY